MKVVSRKSIRLLISQAPSFVFLQEEVPNFPSDSIIHLGAMHVMEKEDAEEVFVRGVAEAWVPWIENELSEMGRLDSSMDSVRLSHLISFSR